MRFFLYLLNFTCLSLLFSCKVNYQQVNNFVKIKEAFIQKEVPGQQGMKPKNYLNIHFLNNYTSALVIDSIVLVNNPTIITPRIGNLSLKVEVTENIKTLTKPIAEIFFRREGDKEYYRQVIQPILFKEPLYLP